MRPQPRRRARHGNVTILAAASILIIAAILMFALYYVSHLGNTGAQHTAIEAAALAAAGDVGRIVIKDDRFGLVSLCDAPPAAGSATLAADNYFTQVKSINEIIGTCRVDCIIADAIQEPFLKTLAEDDLTYVKNTTIPTLTNTINTSLTGGSGGGSGGGGNQTSVTQRPVDVNGNAVDAYTDAVNIYRQNEIAGTRFISMSLSFGGLRNGGVRTNIPIPSVAGNVTDNNGSSNSLNGYYLSDVNIKYGNDDFVFNAVGKQAALVDANKFTTTVPSVPYQNPGVVLVTAQQEFYEQGHTAVQTFTAAAAPGSDSHPPAAGAVMVSFPDGRMPEINKPTDLFGGYAQMSAKSADLATATLSYGDYPTDQNSQLDTPSWPGPASWQTGSAPCAEVALMAFYDWLRCGGSHVQVADPSSAGNSNGQRISGVYSALTSTWDSPQGSPPFGTAGGNPNIPSQVQWIAHAPVRAIQTARLPAGPNWSPIMNPPSNLTTYAGANQWIPGGICHVYQFLSDGSVAYQAHKQTPQPYLVVAEGQLYADLVGTGGNVSLTSAGNNKYDITLPDLVLPTNAPGNSTSHGHHGEAQGTANPSQWIWDVAPHVHVKGRNLFDFYVRDYCRSPGFTSRSPNTGGKHNGADMDMPPLAWLGDYGRGGQGAWGNNNNAGRGGNGKGIPPMISEQVDFALNSSAYPAAYSGYSSGASGGQPRPTYTNGGLVADIRFRRQVDIGLLQTVMTQVVDPTTGQPQMQQTQQFLPYNSNIGYISEMLPDTNTQSAQSNPPGLQAASPPAAP
jgi:hypothetical protein